MNSENVSNQISYREIIDQYGMYIATPVGISMLPMIRERIDTVKLVKPNGRLKKYDVALFQRKDGKYVLHRIVKVTKNDYWFCGDNQVFIEKGVTDDMIIAVMEGFYREEEYIDANDSKYQKYVKKRVRTRIFRKLKHYASRAWHKVFKKR